MFTKRALLFFSIYIKTFHTCGILPYKWNKTERHITLDKSRLRELQRILSMIWSFYATISHSYLVFQGIYHADGLHIVSLVFNFLFANAFFYSAALQVMIALRRVDVRVLINSYMGLSKELERKYLTDQEEKRGFQFDPVEIILGTFLPTSFGGAGVMSLVYVFDAENPRYIYSYLPDEFKGLGTKLALLLWEYYNYLNIWNTVMFGCVTMETFVGFAKFWLEETMREEKSLVRQRVYSPEFLCRLYRILQMMNNLYNYCFSSIFWPAFIFLNITTQVLGIYGMVKLWDAVPIVGYALFPIINAAWLFGDIIGYGIIGSISVVSQGFLQALTQRNGAQKGWAGLMIKSFPPLGLRVSSYFVVNRVFVLSLISFIFTLAINVMIVL